MKYRDFILNVFWTLVCFVLAIPVLSIIGWFIYGLIYDWPFIV